MKSIIVSVIFLLLGVPDIGSSQDSLHQDLHYEVNIIYPSLSISKEKLTSARTLMDLNEYYKSSWVRDFISVEILASNNGIVRKAASKNDILSREQKDIMNTADVGTDIRVKVLYMPENTLKNNDVKEIDFSFMIHPESEAEFPGGLQQMNQYLKENAIDKIPEGSFKNYELTAIKFTIDKDGEIIDAHVFESAYQTCNKEEIDHLLLEVICRMPSWKPAEYTTGVKAKQEFVLTVGNHESCILPLLNIRKDLWKDQ